MGLAPHMAGRDEELRAALDDLRLGRWSAMRDLLWKTGGDWALRTARSQVLAVGAGDGGAVKAWLGEEPFSADALMMWARVLTRQALRALRDGKDDYLVRRVGGVARDACFSAIGRRPEDPVPWVALLDLAKLLDLRDLPYLDPFFGQHPRPHLWTEPPEIGLSPGPWPLLNEVNRRDPGNREGYHRMREYFGTQGSGGLAVDFTRYASACAQRGSVLHILPLYEFVAEYQRRHSGGQGLAIAFWGREQVKHHARKARDHWFNATPKTLRGRLSLLDLNHLAYVLVACGEDGAGEVFEEIGPYATRTPWAQVSASLRRDWQNEFRRMRDSSVRRRIRHR